MKNIKGVRRMPSFRMLWAMTLLAGVAACGGGSSSEAGTSLFGTNTGSDSGNTGDASSGGGITTVSSQLPSQKALSISVEDHALDWDSDGVETKVTVRVADSAGNPVPEGAVVQFSASGGQIQTACALTGSKNGSSTISSCSVTFSTQNPRPPNGVASIVAWMVGEEAYIDSNGNGKYDLGEPFKDMGRAYRDDTGDDVYTSGLDEVNVGGTNEAVLGVGSTSCLLNQPGALNYVKAPSVPNTCDGVWGTALLRAQDKLPIASRNAMGIRPAGTRLVEVFSRRFGATADVAAPTGTALSAMNVPTGCTVTISPASVLSTSFGPTQHQIIPTGTGCPAQISIQAKSGDITKVTDVAL